MGFRRSEVRILSPRLDARATKTTGYGGPAFSLQKGMSGNLSGNANGPQRWQPPGAEEQADRLTRVFKTGGSAHASAQALVSSMPRQLVRRDRRPSTPPRQAPRRRSAATQRQERL